MDSLGNVIAIAAENALVSGSAIGSNAFEIDVRTYYVTPGKRAALSTLLVRAPASASLTSLVTKWMEASSSATAASNYSDITNGAFTVVTAAAGAAVAIQQIELQFDPSKPYKRVYHTITGSASVACELFLVKRIA